MNQNRQTKEGGADIAADAEKTGRRMAGDDFLQSDEPDLPQRSHGLKSKAVGEGTKPVISVIKIALFGLTVPTPVPSCHRSLQNQPVRVTSKPATLMVGFC